MRVLLIFSIIHFVFFLLNWTSAIPFGRHSEPSAGATVLPGKFPPGGVFFLHFLKPGKPLLLKDVLNVTNIPAYTLWTDDYLRYHYGGEYLSWEADKSEAKTFEEKKKKMKFSKFIDMYWKKKDILIDKVPKSMEDEVYVPPCLYCGGFQNQLRQTVLKFGSKEYHTNLQYNVADSFECLLDGSKDYILIDQAYKHLVEADPFNKEDGYSLVNVEEVDVEEFPRVSSAPWHKVTMMKGDCLFVPYRWYSYTHTPEGRHLSVKMEFSHIWWYNKTDCEVNDVPTTPVQTFREFKKQSVLEQTRSEFLAPLSDTTLINKESFLKNIQCADDTQVLQLFHYMDSDQNQELNWSELYSVKMAALKKNFPECLPKINSHQREQTSSMEEEPNIKRANEDVVAENIDKDQGTIEELNVTSTEVFITENLQNMDSNEIVIDNEPVEDEKKEDVKKVSDEKVDANVEDVKVDANVEDVKGEEMRKAYKGEFHQEIDKLEISNKTGDKGDVKDDHDEL